METWYFTIKNQTKANTPKEKETQPIVLASQEKMWQITIGSRSLNIFFS